VANTPLRMHKTWVHEGGISTPLVVHWPKAITAKGELRHNPGHVIDLAPTILEVARSQEPGARGQEGSAAPGRSLVPAFANDNSVSHEYLWWLHENNRAIRVGDWKLVAAVPSLRGRGAAGEVAAGEWELYNLASDRAETKNLAAQMPDKVRELAALWTLRQNEFFALAKQDAPSAAGGKDAAK
jgi:arylsulfatase